MPYTTIFRNFNQPVENKKLLDVVRDIKSGKYKQDVGRIRDLQSQEDFENADLLKKQLPAFTPSGTFKKGRGKEYLDQYSSFVHLDIDKLDALKLVNAFKTISECPYTFACFRSPSNKGLKVLVQVTSGPEQHEHAYKQVQKFYEELTALPCDPKCKDVPRLCFVSDDPETFCNINYKPFEIPAEYKIPLNAPVTTTGPQDHQQIFEDCIRFTEQKEQYLDGNRNNFVYLLACNCNRRGIPDGTAQDLISDNFDLPLHEIKASIKSAYQHHFADFAKFANSANLQSVKQEEPSEDYLKSTPCIPVELYDKMPEILRSGAAALTDSRERDVFFTGALAILSGCLPGVQGVYDSQIVYPNLFSFIIAPAASGKGALKFAKHLADKYHSEIINSSRDKMNLYKEESNIYKNAQRYKKKNDEYEPPPVPPSFRVLYIPANSSYAKILYHLQQNEGEGIICETEADTMGNVFKQEWGGYSDMLRKAFHHERLSSSKKANDEFIEIEKPRLSVALSGTPSQVAGLISSSEDGLFSRFIFYVYKVQQVWKDVSPNPDTPNLTFYFSSLSDKVFEMIGYLQNSPSDVLLTKDQWSTLNKTFSAFLDEVTHCTSENAGSVVKRLGLIAYRISMIFTSMRKFEQQLTESDITCSDADFQTALKLAEIYLQHSLLMFQNLPGEKDMVFSKHGTDKQKFFDALPASFKRIEAIETGKRFKFSTRTVDYILKNLLGSKLHQPSYGVYEKK